jgi:hypothetical protein
MLRAIASSVNEDMTYGVAMDVNVFILFSDIIDPTLTVAPNSEMAHFCLTFMADCGGYKYTHMY